MNPFTPDLKGLSDDDLISKINDLYSKMRMMMNNPSVYAQMQSIMHDFQLEQQLRMEKRRQELDNNELSKKIDIGR